jgi:hypothetical protein
MLDYEGLKVPAAPLNMHPPARERSKLYGDGEAPGGAAPAAAPPADQGAALAPSGNNYGRPGGQNVGNFLTERNSSRVLAAPGGASQIVFGDDPVAPPTKVLTA